MGNKEVKKILYYLFGTQSLDTNTAEPYAGILVIIIIVLFLVKGLNVCSPV